MFQKVLNLEKLEDISRLMVFTWSKSVHRLQRYYLLNLGVQLPVNVEQTPMPV